MGVPLELLVFGDRDSEVTIDNTKYHIMIRFLAWLIITIMFVNYKPDILSVSLCRFQVKKKQFFQNFMTIMSFGAVGTLISFAIVALGMLEKLRCLLLVVQIRAVVLQGEQPNVSMMIVLFSFIWCRKHSKISKACHPFWTQYNSTHIKGMPPESHLTKTGIKWRG